MADMGIELPRHPAKRAQLTSWVVGIVTLPLYGLGLIFLVIAIWRHYANRYECDGEFVRNNQGIIARNTSSVRIRDLRGVNLQQSIAGRILGYGTLSFDTAAGDKREVIWWGVRRAPALQRWFEGRMQAH